MNLLFPYQCWRLGLIVGLLSFGVALAPARGYEITSQTMRYAVNYVGQNAGELEVIIDRDGDSVKITSISHLSNLAKLFLSDQTSETWFEVTADGLRVQRGQTFNRGDPNKVLDAFTIDRAQGKIRFNSGKTEATVVADQFAATSFPIVLMTTEQLPLIDGMEVREISPKRVRWYRYLSPQEETLELDGSTHATWKITRHRRGQPDRTQTFWLHQETRLPLKIVSVSKGKTTEMTLVANGQKAGS